MAVLDCGDVLEVLKLVGVSVVLDIGKEPETVMNALTVSAAVAGLESKKMLIRPVRCGEVMVTIQIQAHENLVWGPLLLLALKERGKERENDKNKERSEKCEAVNLATLTLMAFFSALLSAFVALFRACN